MRSCDLSMKLQVSSAKLLWISIFQRMGYTGWKSPPVLSPGMHCECLRGKQTWMNYFLRLYDQVGQDVGHRQENLPKGQGSYLAAAGHEAGANRHKLQNTTLDLKRKLLRDARDTICFAATQWYQLPQIMNYLYEKGGWVVLFCGGVLVLVVLVGFF